MNFVEELEWRGMVHTLMPGTKELLEKEMVTAYLGIDPTADSLHIGHLCGVMMLRHFQRCGHKPIALIGGATGMIGDPSGKSQERNLLDEETLRHNQACIKKQLSKFLDFESDTPNRAELVNNYDWIKDFSFLDFARTVGKHITVNYMMAKESVQKRLNGEARDGLSFTEFTISCIFTKPKIANCNWEVRTNGAISPQGQNWYAVPTAERSMLSPAHSSPKPTAGSSGKPSRVTFGSMPAIPLPINSTSSG